MSETAAGGGNKNVLLIVVSAIAGLAIGILGTYFITKGMGDDPVVATYNGKSVKASEAFANVKTRLFELEEDVYRTKEQAINDFVEARLLEEEAKKQNTTVDALVEKEAGGAPAEVSDADISSFLASKGLSLNDPRIRKDDVRDYLKYRSKFEKRQQFVQKLRQNAKVEMKIAEPPSPKIAVNTEGFPSWGNPKAPVTIVEFSDFQCPFCARALPILDQIKKEYGPDKVRIVFIDMPLPNHPRAVPSALGAHCAAEQGKFWEYHDVLFQNQQKLEDPDLKEYAKKIGLDSAKFDECYNGKKHEETVNKGRKEAERVNIQATPSFVVNGTLIQGAQPFERFKAQIDRGLKG